MNAIVILDKKPSLAIEKKTNKKMRTKIKVQ